MTLRIGDYVKWNREKADHFYAKHGMERPMIVTHKEGIFIGVKYADTGENVIEDVACFYSYRFTVLPFLTAAAKAIKYKPKKENHAKSSRSKSQSQ